MSIERKNILIVDDSDDIRSMLTGWLEGAGAKVIGCEDGKEAISQLERDDFDLVITDILMPNEDGVSVIRALKQGKRPIPVLAISGGGARHSSHWLLKISQALGVDAVLHKPFEPDEFLTTVCRLM